MRKDGGVIYIVVGFLLMFVSFAQSTESGTKALSLKSAVQIGIDNNPEVKAALEKINASSGRFWSALSPAQPELTITHDDIVSGETINDYGVRTIGVSQSIEFPTNYVFRGSKYAIETDIVKNEYELTKLGVVTTIKKAYFSVLALQKQVETAQENLAITQDFAKKAAVHHAVGEGSNLERLTAKITGIEALNTVEIQKNHLVSALAALNYALGYGKKNSGIWYLTDTLTFIPLDLTMSTLVGDSLAINPQIQIQKLQVSSCFADRTLAWSGLLPNFNLVYFNKQVQGDAQDYYGASLSIGVPVWFFLDQQGKIREASANAAAAESQLKAMYNSVYAKTVAAFTEFKHEQMQVKHYVQEILPQAAEIFRTAAASYEAGAITYLEYLQAQQMLMNARGGYTDALLAYNLSIVAIEEVVGKTIQ